MTRSTATATDPRSTIDGEPRPDTDGQTEDRGGTNPSRREVLTVLGGGAILAGTPLGLLGRATADEHEPTVDGVDAYEFVRMGNTGSFGGGWFGSDTVVARVQMGEGPSDCSPSALQGLTYDESTGLLDVDVLPPTSDEYDRCTTDITTVSYGLVAVVGEGDVQAVDFGGLGFERDDVGPGVDIDDYTFALVDADLSDADRDPTVTVDDGDIVVSGAIELGYIHCETLEPSLLAFDPEWGRLFVEVSDTLADGVDPDDLCAAQAGVQGYVLRISIDVDDVAAVTAIESARSDSRLVTVGGSDLYDPDDPPAERRERTYFECERVQIGYFELPEPVQAEIDEALDAGSYESEYPPLLIETMDVETSYVRHDGTTYEAVVDLTDDLTYALSLEEVSALRLPEPRLLGINNASEDSVTTSIRIEGPDGAVVDTTIRLPANGYRIVETTDRFGTYELTIETGDGQVVEDEFHVSETAFTDVVVEADGSVAVLQAVAGIAPCRFEPDDFTAPWIEIDLHSDRLDPGGRMVAGLYLSYATDRLDAYELEVSVDDTDAARIVAATFEEAFGADIESTVSADGSTATIEVADASDFFPPDGLHLHLAGIELEATADLDTGPGVLGEDLEVSVEATARALTAEDGSTMDPGRAGEATLTVTRETDAPVCGDPRTLNRDGRCRDLNGNGDADFDDVVTFFEHMTDDVVQENVRAFDFNGNDDVDFDDLIALFEEV